MNLTSTSTAILFFSRTARAEARAKAFGFGEAGNLRVAETLINRTRRTLRASGLPIIEVDETVQTGATFGDRLDNALRAAFAQGYDNLLVVGNDAPHLSTRHLRAAHENLLAGRDALVPDRRGGIALLSLRRETYAGINIADLCWESERLFADFRAALSAAIVFTALSDVNTVADLRRGWSHFRSLLHRLQYLLSTLLLPEFIGCFSAGRYVFVGASRGPPAR